MESKKYIFIDIYYLFIIKNKTKKKEVNNFVIIFNTILLNIFFLKADKKKGMEKEDVLSEEGDVTKKDKEDDKIWGKLKKK